MNQQYVFGDFILQTDGTLIHNKRQIHVPPKELAVLIVLLEAGGAVVSKNTLLNQVWATDNVSEESLTRCIYALRRILFESKHLRYINTVYGKGYRFSHPVTVVTSRTSEKKQVSIAVLPFPAHLQLDTVSLHDAIVQQLSQYSPFGMTISPTTMNKYCHNIKDIMWLIDYLNPDYYLTGQIMPSGDSWKVLVELVRTDGHHLIIHEDIGLCSNDQLSAVINRIATTLLPQCIPQLHWDSDQNNELYSPDTAIICQRVRHEMRRYTPSGHRHALDLLQQGIRISPTNALLYCSLVECYLTMSLDLVNARQSANKAVELCPCNPLVLGILGLLNSMQSGHHMVGKQLFRQVHLLAPNASVLYYYHALYLCLHGDLRQAQQLLNKCLNFDPAYIAANVLNIWLIYYNSQLDEAITLSQKLLCQYAHGHPLLQSVLALLFALQGQYNQAKALILAVRNSGEDVGLIADNICCADYYCQGESALPTLETFLSNINGGQARASLLPLVLVVNGQIAAVNLWQQLIINDYPWIKLWRYDPRLSLMMEELNYQSTEEE